MRQVGTNLWLWQLQKNAWCPSSRGAASPSNVWDPPEQQSNPFAIGEHSLLPIVKRRLDPAEYEAQPLMEELDIRRHLSSESFDPADARTVCDGLAEVCRSDDVTIAESLREIQPVYRRIQDLSPQVDEPLPEESTWQNATETLADCPILCRVGNSFEFHEAQMAYFARSPSVRADYPFDDLLIFVLEERRAARFGEYFGLHDFTAAVTEDGEPITTLDERKKPIKNHLQKCVPYILCRLEAERPSQRLIDQDRDRMRSFLDSLTVVDEIEVTYTLDPIGENETRVKTTTTEFYIETKTQGAVEYRHPFVVHRDLEREQWQLLARALCAYLDVTQFEGIDALLSASGDEERRQYLQYANAPASPDAIEQKRLQFDEDQADSNQKTTFGKPSPVNESSGDGTSREDTEESDSARQEEGEQSTSRGSSQSPMAKLYESSELRISGQPIHIEPSAPTSADEDADSHPDVDDLLDDEADEDALTDTTPTTQRRDQSQYDVEDLGAALVEAWEATRLRRVFPNHTNHEEYVFRTDERHLVKKAREGKAKDAIEILQREAGIPEHFPGFDILTVNPETLEPDRLIELKAATCRRRKPTISWNEWTTARNEWIQDRDSPLYYLYVVGHLSKATNPDPYIRTIPNPFRLLDAQIKRDIDVTQTVQVDVNAFSERDVSGLTDEESILEVPVDTASKES
jgi:hypothetical protein